jgi:hypothetical protein
LSASKHACATGNDLQAVIQILTLPDTPTAVNHGVVKPECRITRGGVEISARIACDCL